MTRRIAVLASGRGSNLAALLAAFPAGDPRAEIALVISNREDALALDRAREAGLEAVYIPWPRGGRAAFEAAARELLEARGIDLLLLAGFMRLLSGEFVAPWRGRILNIHPSLLPLYPGLEAQRQALEAGATQTGCTVHFVDAGLDSGDPVLRKTVPILQGDTPEAVAARLLPAEHEAYPQAVRMVLAGLAFPVPTEEEGQAEFGAAFEGVSLVWEAKDLDATLRQHAVRVARLLRAWDREALVAEALRLEYAPEIALARATDGMRLAFADTAPLEERRAFWEGRGFLLQQAARLGLQAEVEAALVQTADEWEHTTF
ncbi:phosphoribosylglycinamide formyltransferase-1 [Deinobacterium chartae]|uniref:Phosphoribosylglycinamide formyltransferase n=1 Tax=Deinobacterium chartae TaxID=521158 RepID=A0A841I0L1_9DEIO|nr:phosphoribosylglycinamide formyltransferase [Deinobacterium chartae]MBB6097652.1 phosphoribosylglycinamide formyltransferase-1 [Deinobacterium chartae]